MTSLEQAVHPHARTRLTRLLVELTTPPDQRELFVTLAGDAAKEVRWLVAERLGAMLKYASEENVTSERHALRRLVQDAEFSVRWRAIASFTGTTTDTDTDIAVTCGVSLSDTEFRVVESAIRYVAAVSDPTRTTPIMAAIKQLANVAAKATALSLLLADKDPKILRLVLAAYMPLNSMHQLSSHADLKAIAALCKHQNVELSLAAAACLRSGELLFRLLLDGDASVRSTAISTIRVIATTAYIERFREFITSSPSSLFRRWKLYGRLRELRRSLRTSV